jgi:hypothetical protein
MRIALFCLFTLSFTNLRAQVGFHSGQSAASDIGVSHYVHPDPPSYRLVLGGGGNIGRLQDDPLTLTASAYYQWKGIAFGGEFSSSSSTSGAAPQKRFSVGGVLFGYSSDRDISGYDAKPAFLHFSVSAGVGIATYSEWWRRFRGRGVIDTNAAAHTNVFETATAFPIQAQLIYEPWRYIGFGTMVWAAPNSIGPCYGASIVLEARY